jgi:hypothetical protein
MTDDTDPFVAACNRTYNEGKSKFGEKQFDAACAELKRQGGLPADVLAQVVSRPDGADLLYTAGRHHPNRSDEDWFKERRAEKAEKWKREHR